MLHIACLIDNKRERERENWAYQKWSGMWFSWVIKVDIVILEPWSAPINKIKNGNGYFRWIPKWRMNHKRMAFILYYNTFSSWVSHGLLQFQHKLNSQKPVFSDTEIIYILCYCCCPVAIHCSTKSKMNSIQ